ncbi:MAG: HD domain-containing protein [Calditrichia bacterium]
MQLKDSEPGIQIIADVIRKIFFREPSGHDWWHIFRVWKMSKHIAREEGADETIVEAAALLHDMQDEKLDHVKKIDIEELLLIHKFSSHQIEHILKIISEVSFRKNQHNPHVTSIESACVQDADRLDAIGAIGIARAFAYGGFKNQIIFDPEKPESTSVQHFYDKLLLIKDHLKTATGRAYAEKRHEFLLTFLQQFRSEWNLQS